MNEQPVFEEHHGKQVWTNKQMDELRKKECLCLNCHNLKPNNKNNCAIAEQLFMLCTKNEVALAVTRCPLWVPTKISSLP